MSRKKPTGHTSKRVSRYADKLMHSRSKKVREVAASALRDRQTKKGPRKAC